MIICYTVPKIWCVTDIYFSFWANFCSFTLTAQKIKILKKWKKTPRDIIILHTCTKNYDQVMYGSWDMVHDRCNYYSFWAIFCPFTPKKWKFEKLKTTPGDIITLHKCTKNHDHMLYFSLDMWHNRFNYFLFWAVFYPFTSLTAQKTKI